MRVSIVTVIIDWFRLLNEKLNYKRILYKINWQIKSKQKERKREGGKEREGERERENDDKGKKKKRIFNE